MESAQTTTWPPRRAALFGLLACAAVLIGTHVFFVAMALVEPITGDGWIVSLDLHSHGGGMTRLLARLRAYHATTNPRLGQAFTFLTYERGLFHPIVTPLVFSLWSVLAVLHATGRWPGLRSLKTASLLLFAFAAAWLSVPALGDAFFYRPIATNYTYSVVLILAYFVPMRLDLRLLRWSSAAACAALMFATGVLIGKLNEHTGPVLVLAAAMSTALALRARRFPDALWRLGATVGIGLGFLWLFFAPGQERRYGKLGRQSIVDTIALRGFDGNLTMVTEFFKYLSPLLVAMVVLVAVYAAAPPAVPERERTTYGRHIWPLVYLAIAALMFGISLAAPKNNYRLCIAPAMFVAIAAISAVDRMWTARAVRALVVVGALAVHLGFVAMCWDTYAKVYAGEQQRIAIAKRTPQGGVAVVPLLPYPRGNIVFFGDTLGKDSRCRKRMAEIYGLRRVDIGAPF